MSVTPMTPTSVESGALYWSYPPFSCSTFVLQELGYGRETNPGETLPTDESSDVIYIEDVFSVSVDDNSIQSTHKRRLFCSIISTYAFRCVSSSSSVSQLFFFILTILSLFS